MSGLETIAALGLACNILQVIEFAYKTVTACKNVLRTGTPDPSLAKIAAGSVGVFGNLEVAVTTRPKGSKGNDQELLDLAKQSLATARELKAEVEKVTRKSAIGSKSASLKVAVAARLKARKIANLEKTLRDYQHVLEADLLARICTRADAISLQQDERFGRLDASTQRFVENFARGQTKLEGLLSQEAASTKQYISAEMARSQKVIVDVVASEVVEIRQGLSLRLGDISSHQDEQMLRQAQVRFLASLKFVTMNERWSQIRLEHEGTFKWILPTSQSPADPEFRKYPCSHAGLIGDCFSCWLQSDGSKLYWVNGKAGSGKSTLMKYLAKICANSRQTVDTRPQELILSHFIWNAGLPIQRGINGVLLSLLHQILFRDELLLKSVMRRSMQNQCKDFHGDWAREELESALFFALSASKRSTVFLDGLDEVGEEDSPHDLLDLVIRLSSLPNVYVCVSSRPEPLFKRQLQSLPSLRVQDLTRRDIEKYVRDNLKPHLMLSEEELLNFVWAVSDKADGVFLWVSLAVKSLLRGVSNEDSLGELVKRLDVLPKSLHALYEQMWERLNEDEKSYREDAARYIQSALDFLKLSTRFKDRAIMLELHTWYVTAAHDPSIVTTILEDPTALSQADVRGKLETASKRIEARTAGLLEINLKTNRVEFIHRSAVEFFRSTETGHKILDHVKIPLEQRLRVLMGAILTRVQLQSYPQLYWRDFRLTPILFVLVAQQLLKLGQISAETCLGILADAKKVHGRGVWHNRNELQAKTELPLDFDGIVAKVGIFEYVAPLVQSMLESSPDCHWSSAYKSYFFARACSRWSIAVPGTRDEKSRLLAWLAERIMAYNGSTVSIYPAPLNSYITQTPGMAMLRMVMESSPEEVWAVPELLTKYLSRNGSLDETAVIMLSEDWRKGGKEKKKHTVSIRFFPGVLGLPFPPAELFLEVNLFFLLHVYLSTVSQLTKSLPAIQPSLDKLRSIRHPTYCRILAHSPGAGNHRKGLLPPKYKFCKPESSADADAILSCFQNMSATRDAYGNAFYVIPALWERLEDILPRERETSVSEVIEDLIVRGVLIREEDLGEWPPPRKMR